LDLRGEEIIGQRRILHKEDLHDLYSSLNINRVMKLRRMRWEEHVKQNGGGEARTELRCPNLKGRDHLEAIGVDGRILLK